MKKMAFLFTYIHVHQNSYGHGKYKHKSTLGIIIIFVEGFINGKSSKNHEIELMLIKKL